MYKIDEEISLIKVLLVDDKKENLFSLETLLKDEKEPIEFIQASSGSEALKVAIKEEVALILLDVQMPEMDGYEVANILKSSAKTRNIPIIFVTALNQDTVYELKGYETGAVDFLFKPLNPAITKAKVKAFIQISQQQKELEKKNVLLENLSLFVKNSLDLMCILEGKDLRITFPNPAWKDCLAYKIEDLENKPLTYFIDKVDELTALLNDSEKHVVELETQLKDKDGKWYWYMWTFVKKHGQWYANGRNITNRKIAEEKLGQAYNVLEKRVKERTEELSKSNMELKKINVDLDNFVYTASHDLKAPILNMEGLVRVLNSLGLSGNKEYEKIVEMLGSSLERLKLTISDLTDIAKIQNESKEDISALRLKSAVDEVKSTLIEMIEENNVEFHEDFKEAPVVNFSRTNMRSILYNLISNAIKYRSPERRPKVKLSSYENENHIILSVRDNGLGIKDEDKEKVFSMFKRLHNHVDGTGLGMYIVKRMVENHNGRIELESKLGEGTVFKVYFPKQEVMAENNNH